MSHRPNIIAVRLLVVSLDLVDCARFIRASRVGALPATDRFARAERDRDAYLRSAFGNRLVGVTTYCDYPAEAQKLPKIGGFIEPQP